MRALCLVMASLVLVAGCGGDDQPRKRRAAPGVAGALLAAPAKAVTACPPEKAGRDCVLVPDGGAGFRVTYRTADLEEFTVRSGSAKAGAGGSAVWTVDLVLDDASARVFARLTRAAVGTRQPVLLLTKESREPISAPVVMSAIEDGRVQVTASGGADEARRIVSLITSQDG